MHVQVGNRVPVYLVVHLLGSKLRAKSACNQHALGPPGASIVERIRLLDVAARHHADVPGQASARVRCNPACAELDQDVQWTAARSVADYAAQWAEIVGRHPVPGGTRTSRCAQSNLGNCDPAVIRRSGCTSRNARIVFRKWSGARDLNPGPHGPEPYVRRALLCPDGSSSVLLYSRSPAIVSSRVLPYPPGSANA